VISSNLANIETPGYSPKKATFSQALRNAMGSEDEQTDSLRLRRTHQKHLPTSQDMDLPYTIESIKGPDGKPSKLNLDHEMARMAKNNLLYEASVQLLSKKFEALKNVIQDGGR
jgi:flagellar basal-body rod protein FlgB